MIVSDLSSKLFLAADIERILGIDKNKLFYWIKTYRLLKPDIEVAKGTGSRAKYSLRNLLELATIKAFLTMGYDLNTIGRIKSILDLPIKIWHATFELFRDVCREIILEDTHRLIKIRIVHTRKGNVFYLDIHEWFGRRPRSLPYTHAWLIAKDVEVSALASMKYFTLIFDIDELANDLRENIMLYLNKIEKGIKHIKYFFLICLVYYLNYKHEGVNT